MYKEIISKRITELRLSKKLSSRKLSLELGLTHSYIFHIENGKTLPSLDALIKICDYFEITLTEFFIPDKTFEAIPPDLIELLESANRLKPNQIKKLSDFIRSL